MSYDMTPGDARIQREAMLIPAPIQDPRNEPLRLKLATIIQEGYVSKRTADKVAECVMEAAFNSHDRARLEMLIAENTSIRRAYVRPDDLRAQLENMRAAIDEAHAALDATGLCGRRTINHRSLADRIRMAIQ